MTTKMTARDKKLLYFVALGAFLFVFVRFLFFPALERHAEAVDALANNEALQSSMQNSLLLAPAAAQEKASAYEALTANSAAYYAELKSDELDALVTGLELQHSLLPLTLNIAEPVPQCLTGYPASSRAGQTAAPGAAPADATQSLLPDVDWAAAYEQAGYFTTTAVSFSAEGSRADFLSMLDDLKANYPSVLLQSFSITDRQATDAEGNLSATSAFSGQLIVILCDKEGVPAL